MNRSITNDHENPIGHTFDSYFINRGVLDTTLCLIKFLSVLLFPPPIQLTATI
jgi:hypothetical protein